MTENRVPKIYDNKQESRSMFYHDKCDKYDYLIAVGCGAVAGIVDIFLVGAPTENIISPLKFHHLPRGVIGCY